MIPLESESLTLVILFFSQCADLPLSDFRLERAVSDCEVVLRFEPENWKALNRRGRAYAGLGWYKYALAGKLLFLRLKRVEMLNEFCAK